MDHNSENAYFERNIRFLVENSNSNAHDLGQALGERVAKISAGDTDVALAFSGDSRDRKAVAQVSDVTISSWLRNGRIGRPKAKPGQKNRLYAIRCRIIAKLLVEYILDSFPNSPAAHALKDRDTQDLHQVSLEESGILHASSSNSKSPSALTDAPNRDPSHIQSVAGSLFSIPDRENFHRIFHQLSDEESSSLFQTFSGNRPIGSWLDASVSKKKAKISRYFNLTHPIDINFCQFFVSACQKDKKRLTASITWQVTPKDQPIFSSNYTVIANNGSEDIVVTTLPMVRNPDDILSFFGLTPDEREVVGWQIVSTHCGNEVRKWHKKIQNHTSREHPQKRLNQAKRHFWNDGKVRYCQALAGSFAKELNDESFALQKKIKTITLVGSAAGSKEGPNDVDVVVVVEDMCSELLDFIKDKARSVCSRFTIPGYLLIEPDFDACPIHFRSIKSDVFEEVRFLHVLLETPETVSSWSPLLSRSRRECHIDLVGELQEHGLRVYTNLDDILGATYGIKNCLDVLEGRVGLTSRYWKYCNSRRVWENLKVQKPLEMMHREAFCRYSIYWCIENVEKCDQIQIWPELRNLFDDAIEKVIPKESDKGTEAVSNDTSLAKTVDEDEYYRATRAFLESVIDQLVSIDHQPI